MSFSPAVLLFELTIILSVGCRISNIIHQGQIARWLEILAEYYFTIQHRSGLKHSNACRCTVKTALQAMWLSRFRGSCGPFRDEDRSNDVTNSVKEVIQGMSSWVPVLLFFNQKKCEQQSDPDFMPPSKFLSYGRYRVQIL